MAAADPTATSFVDPVAAAAVTPAAALVSLRIDSRLFNRLVVGQIHPCHHVIFTQFEPSLIQ
jgi:hypothetical protein